MNLFFFSTFSKKKVFWAIFGERKREIRAKVIRHFSLGLTLWHLSLLTKLIDVDYVFWNIIPKDKWSFFRGESFAYSYHIDD